LLRDAEVGEAPFANTGIYLEGLEGYAYIHMGFATITVVGDFEIMLPDS